MLNGEDFKDTLNSLSYHSYKTIRPELLDKILRKIHEPEEKVRYFWILKLINEYGYDTKKIDINVPAGVGRNRRNVFADIVVFRDLSKTEPLIVGEVKKEGETDGIDGEQGASYARNIGAEYHFWSNKSLTKYWRTSKFPYKSESVGDIPRWIGKKPLISKVPKTMDLPPFRDDKELTTVISACHDLIWAKEGHDPAKAFDELTKLLFLKIYDERETPKYYEFVVLADEKPEKTAKRIRDLFNESKNSTKYRDVFSSRFTESKDIFIELDDFTIYNTVQQLQGYSFISTTETIEGVDIKGKVFEQMVGGTFRGDLGQFFTPREIVEFMVKMLNPDTNNKVLDPACGSGGFLIWIIRAVKNRINGEFPNLDETEISNKVKYFAEHNVFGTDINDRAARVAKMNMIMHGDGHSGIFNLNGLFVNDAAPESAKKNIKDNSFDLIFSNPPFAGYEKEPDILKKFDLGVNKRGNPRSVTKEILFIEKIIKLLKNGGRCAFVLPQGIYSDKKLNFVRDYIKKHCKILALIGLPIWAFRPSGTGVRGSLLFLEKVEDVPEDYKIFVRMANHIGFDSKGRSDKNDLPELLKAYNNPTDDDLISFSELNNCLGYTNTGRIDPRFYLKESRDKLDIFEGSDFEPKRLGQVATFAKERYNPKKDPEKEFIYIEINNVNVRTGGIERKTRRGKDITQGTLVVHEGDLIISRRWPDRGAISIINQEFDGALLVTEFSVLKVEDNAVKQYLYELFRTRQFLDLLDVYTSGEMSHRISEEDLMNVKIPVPPNDVLIEVMEERQELLDKASRLKDEAMELEVNAREKIADILGLESIPQLTDGNEKIMYRRI